MKRLIIIIHLLLVMLSYTAWAWLDYRIVIIVSVAHLAMLEILRGCPLSHLQFPGDKDQRFYEWWMQKIGIRITSRNRRKYRIFMQYVLPAIIIALAILLQVVLGVRVLISL